MLLVQEKYLIQMNQNIQELLIKCIKGKANSKEYQEAYDWVCVNEENRRYFETLYSAWLAAGLTQNVDPQVETSIWNNIESDIRKNNRTLGIYRRNIYPMRLMKIAAILIITFSLGLLSQNLLKSRSNSSDLITVEAPLGAKSFVKMVDGTHIWLNAGSKIQYSPAYNQKGRDIFLSGEAYFDVAKSKSKPFRVHASSIMVQALGTIFNVKAYPEEDRIETTLVEGMIRIESTNKNGKNEQILLKPNQKVSFYRNPESITGAPGLAINEVLSESRTEKIERIEVAKKIEPEIYTSWKDKRWVFKKQKLSDFAIILERIYDVNILFKDEELGHYSLSGSFEEENLEQVLKAIQLTVPLNYTIHHRDVVFSINEELNSNYESILKPSTGD